MALVGLAYLSVRDSDSECTFLRQGVPQSIQCSTFDCLSYWRLRAPETYLTPHALSMSRREKTAPFDQPLFLPSPSLYNIPSFALSTPNSLLSLVCAVMGNCLVCERDDVEKRSENEAMREDSKQKNRFSASKGRSGEHEAALGLRYRFIKNKEGYAKSAGVVSAEEEGVKRVRVVLSKKELLRLLSKCQGDLGSLVDVIGELNSAPRTAASRPSPRPLGERWTPALEAIPEDV